MKKFSFALCACLAVFASCAPSDSIEIDTANRIVPGPDLMMLGNVLKPMKSTETAEIVTIPPSKNCNMKRARNGSKVVNISTYEGGRTKTPLQLAHRVKTWNKPTKPSDGYKIRGYKIQNADLINVIVTETEYPVSLLLTSYDATLWVVHTAPDVNIQNINVVSWGGSSLIAPQVNKSAIKFVSAHYNSTVMKCWKSPERYSDKQDYKDWRGWVHRRIGSVKVSIDKEYRLDAALVGPKPAAPLEPTVIGGTVYVDFPDGDAFWGSKKEAQAKFPPAPE